MEEIKLALAHIDARKCVTMDDFEQIISHLPIEKRNDFLEILVKTLGVQARYLEYPHQIYSVTKSLIQSGNFPYQEFIRLVSASFRNVN
jgi:hypothetical protein